MIKLQLLHFRPQKKQGFSTELNKEFLFLAQFRLEKLVFNSLFMEVEGSKETQTVKFTNCLRNQHEQKFVSSGFCCFRSTIN